MTKFDIITSLHNRNGGNSSGNSISSRNISFNSGRVVLVVVVVVLLLLLVIMVIMIVIIVQNNHKI